MTIATIAAPILLWIFDEPFPEDEILLILLVFLVIAIFFGGLFLYVLLKIGRHRKKIFQNYAALSAIEQAEINDELNTKFSHLHFGAKRLYIKGIWLLEFIDYRKIVWIYPTNTVIPMLMPVEDVMLEGYGNVKGLHIWDTDCTRYKIPIRDSWDSQRIIKLLSE